MSNHVASEGEYQPDFIMSPFPPLRHDKTWLNEREGKWYKYSDQLNAWTKIDYLTKDNRHE